MVGIPNIGNARSFLSISVLDGMTIPKIDAPASAPVSHPHVMSLQPIDQREVGLKKLWLVVSFKHHHCDQYLHLQNADADVSTSLSLYIGLFTLDLARRHLKMFSGTHRVSY